MPAELGHAVRAARRLVVLTGSGVSAESGIPTFRDAGTGLWENFRPQDLATPQAFRRDPKTVWEWYEWRRGLVARARPNAAHRAIARLQSSVDDMTLITQNVDGLHQRAGSAAVLEFHGNLLRNRCFEEDRPLADEDCLPGAPPTCRRCGSPVRPDVVWFGETIDNGVLEAAAGASAACDVFLAVGTAGEVQPAAGLAELAVSCNAVFAEINPDETALSAQAHFCLRGPAGVLMPDIAALFDEE